jgi:hypothetical protein
MKSSEIISLPADFAADSRVWIYQGNRAFTAAETMEIKRLLASFVQDWNSHGHPVKGYAGIFYDRFIVLMADETATGVSGCSTDSSVQLIRQIEQHIDVRLFDRLNLAFFVDGEVRLVPMSQLSAALGSGAITAETPFFNNVIQTKQELEMKWLIPLKNSWLGPKYTLTSDLVPGK